MYMQITWERGNVWRKHRKEGKAGENIGERGYVWRKTMEEMVCLKKTLEKGYVNRKHERERESMQHMRQNREGGGPPQGMFGEHMQERVCLDVWRNTVERVCMEKTLKRGYVWRNILERVCLEKT